jgi:uncharacterized phage protein (TIGR02220 family)
MAKQAKARNILSTLPTSQKMGELSLALEKINRADLQDFVYLLFIFITVNCDDFGRFESNPHLVRAKTYPTSNRCIEDFKLAIDMLESHKLIEYYADGKYLEVIDFISKQKYRSDKRMRAWYPSRDGDVIYQAPAKDANATWFQVIKYLKDKIGCITDRWENVKSFELNGLKARIEEGYTLEDFKAVIDRKYADWVCTDFEKYLVPTTLFKKNKFPRYLEEAMGKSTNKYAQYQQDPSAVDAWDRCLELVKKHGRNAPDAPNLTEQDNKIISTIKSLGVTWSSFCLANQYAVSSIKASFLSRWRQ